MEYRINKGFISQMVGRNLMIFDSEESVIYSLNETAAIIFKSLKNGKNSKEIADSLVRKYRVSEGVAEKDVKDMIADFLAMKVILRVKKKPPVSKLRG